MKLAHEIVTVHTKHTFTIARGGRSEFRVVIVTITDADGATGIGEAAPSRFYGETAETVIAALAQMQPILEKADAWSIEDVEREINALIRYNGAAKAAVNQALLDLQCTRLGAPFYKVLGLSADRACPSSFTIGIGSDDELRQKVKEAAEYPILKVKLGSDRDDEIIGIIREEAPDKILRVDANAAWTPKHALAMIELLIEYDVEFVEQPLAATDLEGLRFVRERSPLPIIADESCITSADIPLMVGVVDGINIKLAKCGGPREALRMIHTARSHGLLVMMGCMIETSVGITAAAHLAPLLDFADLDGAALLSDDPYRGATIAGGQIAIPSAPGFGVTRA